MRKLFVLLCVLSVFVVGFVADSSSGAAPLEAEAFDLVIKVSPSTIALGSDGGWLTVHTNIGLGAVACDTLALNDIPVSWAKADSRGNLVAKFKLSEVKKIVQPPTATLTLTGEMKDGTPLAASDTVRVVK